MKNYDVARLIFNVLRSNGVSVTLKGLQDSLFAHPYYPSIQSVLDCLADLKVAAESMRVSFSQLEELVKEADVLLFLKDKGEDYFVSVERLHEGEVYVRESDKQVRKYTQSELAEVWDGVTIAMQADSDSDELTYAANKSKKSLRNIYLGCLSVGFLLLLGMLIVENGSAGTFSILLIPKLLGLFFSVLLASTELGFKLPIAEKLCAISTNDGCAKVLHSKASSFGKYFQLADVGIAYFSSVLLYVLISSFAPQPLSYLQTLSSVSLLALPFVVFSVTYQTLYVKAFCPLCLSVMSMLVLDALAYYLTGYVGYAAITFSGVLMFVGCSLLTAGGWMVLKQPIQQKKQLQDDYYKHQQLRKSPERFAAMLQGIEEEALGSSDEGITLGDPSGSVVITEVFNPYCNPCAKAMRDLVQLLEVFPEGVRANIRFVSARTEEREHATLHLLAFARENEESKVKQALLDWFDTMDYNLWKEKYPVRDPNAAEEQYAAMAEWGKVLKISHTPTTFIQQKRIPTTLSLSDMRYWLTEQLS